MPSERHVGGGFDSFTGGHRGTEDVSHVALVDFHVNSLAEKYSLQDTSALDGELEANFCPEYVRL
jgi:hypothetical protein